MKKQIGLALTSAAVALGAVFPGSAAAQRVQEETLIYTDPTVATSGKWLIGAALEYWYVSGEYDLYDSTGTIKQADGDIKYKQPGFNIYLGYGDFTLMYTSRSGDGDIDFQYRPGALGPNVPLNTTSEVEQEDREITLRWIFAKSAHFNPYLVVGYSWTDYDETQRLTTPGFIWTATGTTTRSKTVEYTAPLIGIGAVIPFNEHFGMRADVRLKFYDAKQTGRGFRTVEDSGTGGDGTATFYVNIFEGLNFQAGGRFTHLDGGELIGSSSRIGWFGMLGYTLRF